MPDEMRQHEFVVQRRSPAHADRPPAARARTRRRARAAAIAAQGSCAHPAAFRKRGTRRARDGRSGRRANRACRCRFRSDAYCRRHRQADCGNSRSTSQRREIRVARSRRIGECDLQLIQRIVPRLVDARRLAGRADEEAGEEIGQRRMPLPIEHEALQQIGPSQERRVRRRHAAEHDMIAAARADATAVRS